MPRQTAKRSSPLPIEPLVVRRPEAARVLGIGMTKLKEMIKNREVEEVRFGTASVITVRSLRARVGEP